MQRPHNINHPIDAWAAIIDMPANMLDQLLTAEREGAIVKSEWNGRTNLMRCIIMKVLWGTLYWLTLGAVRLKRGNCYLGILVHGVLNIFG